MEIRGDAGGRVEGCEDSNRRCEGFYTVLEGAVRLVRIGRKHHRITDPTSWIEVLRRDYRAGPLGRPIIEHCGAKLRCFLHTLSALQEVH